jgi:hypothetical protein
VKETLLCIFVNKPSVISNENGKLPEVILSVTEGTRTIQVNNAFERSHGVSFQTLTQVFQKNPNFFECVYPLVFMLVVCAIQFDTKYWCFFLRFVIKKDLPRIIQALLISLKVGLNGFQCVARIKVPGAQMNLCLVQVARDFNCRTGVIGLIVYVPLEQFLDK